MSWRNAVAVAALLALGPALAGCGWRPMYGDLGGRESVAHAAFQEIQVGVIPDRSGQILRNFLIRQLNPAGRPTDPRYRLDVTVAESVQDLGVLQDDTATRANVIVNASYRLTEIDTGTALTSGSLTAITSSNILRDEYATRVATESARDRGLRELSNLIRLRLGLYFNRMEPQSAAAGTPAGR